MYSKNEFVLKQFWFSIPIPTIDSKYITLVHLLGKVCFELKHLKRKLVISRPSIHRVNNFSTALTRHRHEVGQGATEAIHLLLHYVKVWVCWVKLISFYKFYWILATLWSKTFLNTFLACFWGYERTKFQIPRPSGSSFFGIKCCKMSFYFIIM